MTSTKRWSWVDVLRGVAVGCVMMFHARQALWVGMGKYLEMHPNEWSFTSLGAYLLLPFRFGYMGVQLFFVLSGYCIHARLAQENFLNSSKSLNEIDWWLFGKRRFFRLYPAYIVAVILTLLCGLLLRTEHDWKTLLGNLLFFQNTLVSTLPYNDAFWSLAVEVQLYLLYPFLLMIVRRWGWKVALVSMGILSIWINMTFFGNMEKTGWMGLGLTLSAWFPWSLGMAISEWHARGCLHRPHRGWMLMAVGCMFLALFFHVKVGNSHSMQDPLLGVTFGWILTVGLTSRFEVIESYSLFRWLSFTGVISYSLYLTHRPIQYLMRNQYEMWSGGLPESLGLCLMGMGICWFVGWGIYRGIERPWSIRS